MSEKLGNLLSRIFAGLYAGSVGAIAVGLAGFIVWVAATEAARFLTQPAQFVSSYALPVTLTLIMLSVGGLVLGVAFALRWVVESGSRPLRKMLLTTGQVLHLIAAQIVLPIVCIVAIVYLFHGASYDAAESAASAAVF